MGIGTGIGASTAASEMIHAIDTLIKKATQQETLDALNELRQKAVEIKQAGDGGWY